MLLTVESFYNLYESKTENTRVYFKQKRTKYQTHFLQVEMCKIYIFMIDKINRKGHLNEKTFKKLIAIVMATTTMAVGFGGMSVSAVSETASWSARYVNVHGAPTTESRTGYAIMQASSEVYTGKVNTMSDITNRSLTLSSTSHVMTTGSIVYNNTGSRRWYIRGKIEKVTYKMEAYTSLKAVLYVTGIISR